jgi:hypothetical protein
MLVMSMMLVNKQTVQFSSWENLIAHTSTGKMKTYKKST